MKSRVKSVSFLCLILVLFGCEKKEKTTDSFLCDYESYGLWSSFSGNWKSINDAAGEKHASWAYLNVTLSEDGTFSGTYESYVFDYVYNMPTHMGTIPVPVYNPGGDKNDICGVIDFKNKSGEATFRDIGKISFTLEEHSSNELAFVYSSGFNYTVSNIKR